MERTAKCCSGVLLVINAQSVDRKWYEHPKEDRKSFIQYVG